MKRNSQLPTQVGGLGAPLAHALAASRRTGHLNLSSRELTEVPSALFAAASDGANWWEEAELVKLCVRDNAIEALPAELGQLTALTLLDVGSNRLTSLDGDSMAELRQLRALDVGSNPLVSLPDAVATLPALASLSCGRCGLPALPDALGGNQQPVLAGVAAAGNRLTRLPSGFACAAALVKLDLQGNALAALDPAALLGMTSLVEMDLSYNALQACAFAAAVQFAAGLPPEIGCLKHLQLLTVSTNRLTALPSELGDCASLVELCASRNALGALPPELGRLVMLRTLSLSNNRLQELPEELCGLELRLLDLGNNSLRTLPPRLGFMTSLRSIVLEGNPLRLVRRQLWSGPVSALLEYLRSRLPDAGSEANASAVPCAAAAAEPAKRAADVAVHGDGSLACRPASVAAGGTVQKLAGTAQELVLRGRGLRALPPELQQAAALLSKLDLSDNPLGAAAHALPGLLSACTALRFLALNNVGLAQWPLPAVPAALPRLAVLQLRGNCIAVLPAAGAFAAVPAVRDCDLSGVPAAAALPHDLGAALPALESLSLAGCGLSAFPLPVLGLGASLLVLSLEANRLERVPAELVQLTRLETLNLTNNQLLSLPPQLGLMRHLRALMLEGNVLRTIRRPLLSRGTPALLEYLLTRLPC